MLNSTSDACAYLYEWRQQLLGDLIPYQKNLIIIPTTDHHVVNVYSNASIKLFLLSNTRSDLEGKQIVTKNWFSANFASCRTPCNKIAMLFHTLANLWGRIHMTCALQQKPWILNVRPPPEAMAKAMLWATASVAAQAHVLAVTRAFAAAEAPPCVATKCRSMFSQWGFIRQRVHNLETYRGYNKSPGGLPDAGTGDRTLNPKAQHRRFKEGEGCRLAYLQTI